MITVYHGSPCKTIKSLLSNSWVSRYPRIAYDMGRFHISTGKTWTDDDLEDGYNMDFPDLSIWKQGREPKGIPTLYSSRINKKDLYLLNRKFEHKIKIHLTELKIVSFPLDQ